MTILKVNLFFPYFITCYLINLIYKKIIKKIKEYNVNFQNIVRTLFTLAILGSASYTIKF